MSAIITLTAYQFEIVRLLAERSGQTIEQVLVGFFGCNAPARPVPHEVHCTGNGSAAAEVSA